MKIFCGLLALLALCTTALGSEEEEDPVIHGTINVVLANKNGMVVLTDSMLTAGDKQLPTPGKKLFRLDDHSVCAIAGIIASPSGSYKELDLSTVALVNDYAGQVSAGQPITIAQKLRELAFLLNINISAVENVRNANGSSLNPDSYILQLIVAGYDTDGILKIGKVTLRSQNLRGNFDSEIESGWIRSATEKLDKEFSGMPDRAEFIMAHPETVPGDKTVSEYQLSLKSDGGKSLTLEQLAELAKRLKVYSGLAHREVGGPDQIAILQNGKISSFTQPPFPDSPPVRKFSLVVASSFRRSSLLFRGNTATIFVRCFWNQMVVPIDGNFFSGSVFMDSLLTYNGGPLHFDITNKVIDSDLLVGLNVKQYSEELTDLRRRFIAGRTVDYDPMRFISLHRP
jgi:20S proteasome alpha/beta subunit